MDHRVPLNDEFLQFSPKQELNQTGNSESARQTFAQSKAPL